MSPAGRARNQPNAAPTVDFAGQELRDPITGLAAPRLLMVEGAKELAFARRHCVDLALVFFQLDSLTQAHGARGGLGDVLVQQFVYCLRRAVRAEDTVARLDGKRFAVLARETNAFSARMLTRRVLELLREMRDPRRSFSDVSVGIATPRAYRCQRFDEFVDLALHCLDTAVTTGGGRVVAARTEENLRKLKAVPRRSGSHTGEPTLGMGTTPTQNVNIAMWLIEEGFIDQIEPHADSAHTLAPLLKPSEHEKEFDMGEVRVRLSRTA